MKPVLLFFMFFFYCISPSYAASQYLDPSILEEGDIIFQESLSRQSKAIKLATRSRYTHAGIIFKFDGRFRVLEAVQPVQVTDLDKFISRGTDRHFVIKRLKNRGALLNSAVIAGMKEIGRSYIGKNYDIYFEWDDSRIYCTELIWKIYYGAVHIELGKLAKLRDFDLTHPYVKNLMKKRFGKNIPYDEPVISPDAMFKSKKLITIAGN